MTSTRVRVATLAALAAILGPAGTGAAQRVTAFTGATVWDGTGAPAMGSATLVVRDGRIESVGSVPVPAGAAVVDLSGRWVVPGLVDAHAHVTGAWAPDGMTGERARLEADLRLFARHGVTTVNSLGGEPVEAAAVRAAQADPGLDRARLLFAGPVIAATTGSEAAALVASNAEAGVDWIKMRVDDNLGTTSKMPWPAVEAVIEGAHGRGLRVATHLFYLDDAKQLLRTGTDLVAHSIRDARVDLEVIELLRARDVCYVPTLTRELSTFVYAERPAFFDDPFFQQHASPREVERVLAPAFQRAMAASPAAARYRDALRQAQQNLLVLHDAGIRIAFGTDAGPPARFPGYFEHLELALMVEAGLSPAAALRSATAVAADCLGLPDVGTLEPGKWADFLVLDADPLADVSHSRRLRAVYVAGNEVR